MKNRDRPVNAKVGRMYMVTIYLEPKQDASKIFEKADACVSWAYEEGEKEQRAHCQCFINGKFWTGGKTRKAVWKWLLNLGLRVHEEAIEFVTGGASAAMEYCTGQTGRKEHPEGGYTFIWSGREVKEKRVLAGPWHHIPSPELVSACRVREEKKEDRPQLGSEKRPMIMQMAEKKSSAQLIQDEISKKIQENPVHWHLRSYLESLGPHDGWKCTTRCSWRLERMDLNSWEPSWQELEPHLKFGKDFWKLSNVDPLAWNPHDMKTFLDCPSNVQQDLLIKDRKKYMGYGAWKEARAKAYPAVRSAEEDWRYWAIHHTDCLKAPELILSRPEWNRWQIRGQVLLENPSPWTPWTPSMRSAWLSQVAESKLPKEKDPWALTPFQGKWEQKETPEIPPPTTILVKPTQTVTGKESANSDVVAITSTSTDSKHTTSTTNSASATVATPSGIASPNARSAETKSSPGEVPEVKGHRHDMTCAVPPDEWLVTDGAWKCPIVTPEDEAEEERQLQLRIAAKRLS